MKKQLKKRFFAVPCQKFAAFSGSRWACVPVTLWHGLAAVGHLFLVFPVRSIPFGGGFVLVMLPRPWAAAMAWCNPRGNSAESAALSANSSAVFPNSAAVFRQCLEVLRRCLASPVSLPVAFCRSCAFLLAPPYLLQQPPILAHGMARISLRLIEGAGGYKGFDVPFRCRK